MRQNLAHIFDSTGASGLTWWLLVAIIAVFVLIVEHHVVAGFDRATCARRAKRMFSCLGAVAISAALLPTSGAQPAGALPDLISDPPNPSFFTELTNDDGSTALVVTFDGYVHNIGQGALDVVGNPQEPGGMKQRVQTDGEWQEVGSPTVRYETDDGHNHFHLIEAIEYVLWNEQQGQQAAIGSKVGFCLVDSEQMSPGTDQAYSEEGDNFCEEGNPDATSLRVGISPGWRDIYDATTTLQWVDISNVEPGRYWIGAITDPNDEILESNEENNSLIFSDVTISVPGFEPLQQPTVVVDEPRVATTLSSYAHGNVTEPIYVIESGPSSGVLDVPIGVDLRSDQIHYYPANDFVGEDEITFSVRDAVSPYPFDAPTQTITFSVEAGASRSDTELGPGGVPSLVAPTTLFELTTGQPFATTIDVADAIGGPARLFANNLPPGLRVHATTGEISGEALSAGVFEGELIAVGTSQNDMIVQPVTWFVTGDDEGLPPAPDRSTTRGTETRLRVGASTLGLTYEADGLPDGLSIEPTSPVIVGSALVLGDFDVTIRQLDEGRVVSETSFKWNVRPANPISFAL